ncbi:Spo0B domain-containing protein [Paenibacillus filicis]|uniref:Spo0B domain-containing protein n=1 Tax=Paenibacillus gyeongsangnamensis TaxID=3388067 RepID=A0ABT4Q945_9BACL|nr:Spo0B domain-containing protein [Paenibacillus filicis]MCZ8513359.1 Spo0B domain-containing protein [Paenibacillus filicis]
MTSDTNRLIRNTELGQGLRQLPGSESANDETDQNLRLLRLFNHYRHDWMNDIQILFWLCEIEKV